ncbi:MAG: hypothetical protein M3Y91_14515, partial [Actinomycetota bacterium]|nr:hypothetical protein [Actinomycetota bacterium]
MLVRVGDPATETIAQWSSRRGSWRVRGSGAGAGGCPGPPLSRRDTHFPRSSAGVAPSPVGAAFDALLAGPGGDFPAPGAATPGRFAGPGTPFPARFAGPGNDFAAPLTAGPVVVAFAARFAGPGDVFAARDAGP